MLRCACLPFAALPARGVHPARGLSPVAWQPLGRRDQRSHGFRRASDVDRVVPL